MHNLTRRNWIQTAGASASILALTQMDRNLRPAFANEARTDSLPMQLYKSLSDSQKQHICLPMA